MIWETDCAWKMPCDLHKDNPTECPRYADECKMCKHDYPLDECGEEDGDTFYTVKNWRLP